MRKIEVIKEKILNAAPYAAAVGAGMACVGALATGDASAAVGNETVAFYGLSVVDWFLVAIGAIGFIIGAYLRDLRIVGIGTILLILGGVANYLGV